MQVQLRALILTVFCLGPAAAAADTCAHVDGLTRIYQTMDTAAATPGGLSEEAARRLLAQAQRFNSRAMVRDLQETEIATYADTVVAPLQRLLAEGSTQVGDRTVLAGLDGAGTRHALNRAIALMARLDCSDEMGEATEDGYRTGLMRSLRGALSGEGGVLAVIVPIGGSGIALLCAGLIIFMVFRRLDAKERLKQRYVCSIPATVGPGTGQGTGTWQDAQVLDLSREGVKLTAVGKATPRVGDRFCLRIDGQEIEGTVRWANHHAFGALFRLPLSPEELDALLGHSRTQVRVLSRHRRHRGQGAQTKSGTPRDAARQPD